MTVPAPPTGEVGYAAAGKAVGALGWADPVLMAATSDLIWPADLPVYERMRSEDAQPASALRAVALPVLSTQWGLDLAGCRDEVGEDVARNLGLAVHGQPLPEVLRTRDRFSWHDHLRHVLTMLAFGHAFFEQVYRPLEDGRGRHALRKLAWRPPMTLSAIEVARDGGLVGIRQYGVRERIDVSRLVAYVNEREGGNWRGRSLFRPIVKNQRAKDFIMRTDLRSVDRNGNGLPDYEAGPDEPSLDAGKALVTNLRSGDMAGAARPTGSKLRLLGVEGQLPDMLAKIEYQDRQMFAAILLNFMSLGGNGPGSYALGAVQAQTFTNSLQSLAQQVCDTAQQHVIEDLVDVNFGPDEPAPRLVFERIGSHQAATAQALKLLTDAGVLYPDRPLEEAVRQSYGLPPKQSQTGAA